MRYRQAGQSPVRTAAFVATLIPSAALAQGPAAVEDGAEIRGRGFRAILRIDVEEDGMLVADAGAGPPGPDASGTGDLIGDPWWDEASDPTAGEAPADGGPAHAATVARRQAHARLAEVRRHRGVQILRRELSLVRAACPALEPAARARILAAGREAVGSQAAGRIPLVNGVEAALEEALGHAAGTAAAAAYRAELVARSARRRTAAIAMLVASIDRDAVLDAENLAALRAALDAHWRSEWEAAVGPAGRPRTAAGGLPAGVAEVAAAALDAESCAGWRRRLGEAVP